jgi:hypothetical protein
MGLTSGSKRCPLLLHACPKVNGRTIVRWARFLAGDYASNVCDAEMNDAAVVAYSAIAGVPESLLNSAIASATEEEAEALQRVGGIRQRPPFVVSTCA